MAEKDFHISEKYNFRHALVTSRVIFRMDSAPRSTFFRNWYDSHAPTAVWLRQIGSAPGMTFARALCAATTALCVPPDKGAAAEAIFSADSGYSPNFVCLPLTSQLRSVAIIRVDGDFGGVAAGCAIPRCARQLNKRKRQGRKIISNAYKIERFGKTGRNVNVCTAHRRQTKIANQFTIF